MCHRLDGHSLDICLAFQLLGCLTTLGDSARAEEGGDEETVEDEPAKSEPERGLDVGPVVNVPRVQGEQTSLDGEGDDGSELEGDLEESSHDSRHGSRYRGHDGDATRKSVSAELVIEQGSRDSLDGEERRHGSTRPVDEAAGIVSPELGPPSLDSRWEEPSPILIVVDSAFGEDE